MGPRGVSAVAIVSQCLPALGTKAFSRFSLAFPVSVSFLFVEQNLQSYELSRVYGSQRTHTLSLAHTQLLIIL